ncbi:MAG: type IX secretion system membrane protein PorP/SprF [Bacteroidales bacterium]|nr:type IX secretion system membrane protein PorP/SprF [Bacteroidales bacterium]
MRKIVIFILILFNNFLKSQQIPMYSQFSLNDFAYNPAIAGTKDYYQAKSNNRYQWIGISDAPRTYILSVHGPHKVYNMGYGGILFNDITGPVSKIGLYGIYAYNLQISEDIRLSGGLALGLLQVKIDGSKILLHDYYDPALGYKVYRSYVPDASLGLYAYTENYSAGIIVSQMFGTNIKYKEIEELSINKLKQHIIIHGSYNYKINEDWEIEPVTLIKYISPVPIQLDICVKTSYRKLIWCGLGIRTKDAVIVTVGYNYQDQLLFGYSYDLSFSNLKKYNSGTHELMIGINFNKYRKKEWKAKLE